MAFLWFCIALSLFFMIRFRRRHMYKFAGTFSPCSKELPLIGVAHKLSGNTEEIMGSLKNFSIEAIGKDGIVRVWLNHILYFIAVDPVDVEMLLKACLEKDDLHRFLRPVTGNGGIFAPCSIWRRRRKTLIPAFSPKIVESFVDVFTEQSEILASRLTERAGADKFKAWPYVSTYTLDSVCQTVMGVKVNAQNNPNTPFLVSLNAVLNLVCARIFHLWLQPDWLYRLFPQYAEQNVYINQMHGFTDEVIRRKREELKTEQRNLPEVDSAVYNSSNYRMKTFLDHLIHLSGKENGYTDIELREEVLTLIIAGTDTSAVAIGNTLKMLAKYPDVQKRAYEEINGVFGDSDRQLVAKDLQQLKFLERVVKETLRLFPPVPFVIRKVEENITLQTVMGVKVNAQNNPNTPFLVSLNAVLNLVCARIFHLWLQPDWLYRLFPQYAEQNVYINQMHGFTDEVIRRKREELKTEQRNLPEVDSAVYNSSNYRMKTFLDHLIHLSGKENGYTDIELREEVLTLIIAGTDTSAVAIGNTLKMLAKYPDVQKRAYEEINGVFGDSDRQLVAKDLQQLKFLERVVKETLRLFPPVPFVIRKVEENITLPSGRVLPAGSGVVISIWGIHRDPAHWGPDSTKFDPDRFLPDRLNLKHVCSFMPFSQGPRNCVGYQYALMSIKTALAAVLRKFIVVPDPERGDIPYIRVKLDIMMKDVDGYTIGLQLRKPHANNDVPEA